MSCYNHPNAPAIAQCQRCAVQLCGQCTQFLEARAYCEKCAEALVAESFVAARKKQLAQHQAPTIKSKRRERPESRVTRRRDKDSAYVWLGFGGSSAMVFFALLIYAFPMVLQFDNALAAEREAYQALEDCRLVFEEIGYLLEQGLMPDESYRCAESAAPNIVRQNGDQIRISHPNPAAFGLVDMYVSSKSHEVIFVEAREV